MRRIALTVATVIFIVVLLCGCADGLSGLRMDRISKIEIINMISGNRIELDQNDPQFKTISPLIVECQESFVRGGDCHPEDGHQYQMIIYTDSKTINITINDDGSFCAGRIHYVPASDSDGLGVYIIRRATAILKNPYLLEIPEQVSQPVELVQNSDWTYFCQQILLDGAQYTVLARQNRMEYQVIHEIREPYGDRVVNSMAYVADSLAASDHSVLYFSLDNNDTGVSCILGFSIVTDTIVLLPGDPCSNLLIVNNGNKQYGGWLVCGNAIYSVDLTSGEMAADSACTVSDLGGLPEIDGALFRDPRNVAAIRSVKLAEGSADGTIDIQIWQSETGGEPEMIQVYTYNFASSKLI